MTSLPTTLSRSVLAVLIPGIVAISPWLLALVLHTSATLGLGQYPAIAYALLFALAAVVGTIFEGLGSHLESRWDIELESDYNVVDNWYAYLAYNTSKEPVGFRYLSTLATSLYFELSMLFSVPIFVAGTGVLTALRFRQYACAISASSIILSAITILYFWWQARCTHKVLCTTRRELNVRLVKTNDTLDDKKNN